MTRGDPARQERSAREGWSPRAPVGGSGTAPGNFLESGDEGEGEVP